MIAAALTALTLLAAPALPQSLKPLTRDEFQAQQTAKYKRYDLNGDGKLPADEMLKARPNRQDGSAYTLDSVQKSLAKRDADKDGVVSIVEAVASEMPRFERMDTNKDGTASSEERANEPK